MKIFKYKSDHTNIIIFGKRQSNGRIDGCIIGSSDTKNYNIGDYGNGWGAPTDDKYKGFAELNQPVTIKSDGKLFIGAGNEILIRTAYDRFTKITKYGVSAIIPKAVNEINNKGDIAVDTMNKRGSMFSRKIYVKVNGVKFQGK